eukprot:360330_1
MIGDKKLKITTILRWMNSQKSKMHAFDEVEVVNDKPVVLKLYYKLEKYLEYKADANGKRIVIQRMKRNKCGKTLRLKYGFDKANDDEHWVIESIDGRKVSIDRVLKQVDVKDGYDVVFKKKQKARTKMA